MSEVRTVQTQQVDERCPACRNGWMRPNGIVTNTNPPQYTHRCTDCGYEHVYGVRYPYYV